MRKPNIVFIVLDTHRADRLGCYGYDKATSPNIDAFAAGATKYLKAISPAQWTIPSHASMFSGQYPSVHGTVQSSDALPEGFSTIAEHLSAAGYKTVGFCNNPLVGVLDNHLRRGFREFYNYGGAIPTKPGQDEASTANPVKLVQKHLRNTLQKIAEPIQNAVAQSEKVLAFTLNPLLVPLWSRYANFKGDTAASLRDATTFLQNHPTQGAPLFLFLNLMGTHLPYQPPKQFSQKFAPVYHDDPTARTFMKKYNTQALKWLLPLDEPYSPLEAETLSGMYDAEVAYQDHQLAELLETLSQPVYRENTMVVIVADHGEMLGEHQIMGHGLGVYQNLIHVPLIIRVPKQEKPDVIAAPFSTTKLYQTVLNQAGISLSKEAGEPQKVDAPQQNGTPVVAEAYPPENVLRIMEKNMQDLMVRFHTDAVHRAIYQDEWKLIRIDGIKDMMFNLVADPKEVAPLENGHVSPDLAESLTKFTELTAELGTQTAHSTTVNLNDEALLARLRGLGYIE